MAGSFNSQDDEIVSGINVTPLVDVVLVLLIIFMITAPVIYQSQIKVSLPQAKSGEENQKTNPLQFILTKSGDLIWNSKKTEWTTFPNQLKEYLKTSADASKETASLAADKETPHGIVVKCMDILRQAGIVRFALTVENKK